MRNFANIVKNPLYAALATVTGLLVFASATLLPNKSLLFSVWTDPSVALESKMSLTVQLLGGVATNFASLTATYLILIAVLSGVNVALITYLLKSGGIVWKGSFAGLTGIFSGVMGIGCAACGPLILSAILGTAVGASAVAALPLRGGEFGILGVLLLLVATYLLGRQILQPPVCDSTNATS
jgi:hypothetical protein